MSWIVRIVVDDSKIETMTTAAIMADSTGCAEVTDPAAPGSTTLLIGFDTKPDADRFGLDYPGASIEPVEESTWARTRTSAVPHASGPLELEVGTAFGHGGHPTTQLALDALAELGDGEGRTLLDVGCGTGVLSIAAARQGFVVSGCDIDPEAVAIAVRNAERNAVADRVSFVCATPTQLATPAWLMRSRGFDSVVINTLVGVHESEAAAISSLASESAPILVTGIQGETQLARVEAAYDQREIRERRHLDPWVLAVLSTR